MLTRILHNFEKLCAFLDDLELYKPQRSHLLDMTDFRRISPWQAAWLRDGLRSHQLSWLLAEVAQTVDF